MFLLMKCVLKIMFWWGRCCVYSKIIIICIVKWLDWFRNIVWKVYISFFVVVYFKFVCVVV